MIEFLVAVLILASMLAMGVVWVWLGRWGERQDDEMHAAIRREHERVRRMRRAADRR